MVAAHWLVEAVPERVSPATGSYACGVDSFYLPGVHAVLRDVGEDPDRIFSTLSMWGKARVMKTAMSIRVIGLRSRKVPSSKGPPRSGPGRSSRRHNTNDDTDN